MTQVNGYATPVLPYQMGPLILGIAIGGIRPADGARIMLPLTLFTIVLVLPLDYLWWRFLGYLGCSHVRRDRTRPPDPARRRHRGPSASGPRPHRQSVLWGTAVSIRV